MRRRLCSPPPHRARCCPVEYYPTAAPTQARYTTEFRHDLAGDGYAGGAGTRTPLTHTLLLPRLLLTRAARNAHLAASTSSCMRCCCRQVQIVRCANQMPLAAPQLATALWRLSHDDIQGQRPLCLAALTQQGVSLGIQAGLGSHHCSKLTGPTRLSSYVHLHTTHACPSGWV